MANEVNIRLNLDTSDVNKGVNSTKQVLLNLIGELRKKKIELGGMQKAQSDAKALQYYLDKIFNGNKVSNLSKGFNAANNRLSDLKANLSDLKTQYESFKELRSARSDAQSRLGLRSGEMVERTKQITALMKEREQFDVRQKGLAAFEVARYNPTHENFAEYEKYADRMKETANIDWKYSSVEQYTAAIRELYGTAADSEKAYKALENTFGKITSLQGQDFKYDSITGYENAISKAEAKILGFEENLATCRDVASDFEKETGIALESIGTDVVDKAVDDLSETTASLEQATEDLRSQIQSIKMASTQEATSAQGGTSVASASGLATSGDEILSKGKSILGLFKNIGSVGSNVLGLFKNIGNAGSIVFSNLLYWPIMGLGNALGRVNAQVGDLGFSFITNLGKKALRVIKPFGSAIFEISKTLLGFNLFKSIGGFITSLGTRILRLASGAFIFRAMGAALRQLRKDVVEAFGTYLNYDNDLSSSINNLKSQFTELKGQLASAFAPIIEIIVPYLSQFVGWCVSAANALSALIASLTGKTSWKKAVINSTGAVSNSASDATKNLNDAADAADELKEKLGAYDELNVIQGDNEKKSKSGSGNGSGGSGGGGNKGADISYVEQSIGDNIKNLADWLKDMWEKADFTELGALVGKKLKDALDKIPWDEIKQKAYKIGRSIATFLNGFFETPGLGNTLGKTIAEFINTGLSAAYGFIHNFHFDSFGQFLADLINGIINTLDFDLAASILREGFNGIFLAIKTATDPIKGIQFGTLGAKLGKFIQDATKLDWKTAYQGFYNLGRGIAEFANNLITPETLGSLGSAVAGCVNTITSALKGFITNANWKQYGQSIASFFNNLVKDINWKQLGEDFGGAIKGLLTTIRTFLATLDYKEILNAFLDFFKGVFKHLTWGDIATIALSLLGLAIVKGVATTFMTAITGLGTTVVSSIVGLIASALPVIGVVAIVSGLIYMLWRAVQGAVDDLDKLDWKAIGTAIRGAIVNAIDGAVGLVLNFIANVKEVTKDIPVIGWIIDFIARGAEFTVNMLGKLAKGDILGFIRGWVIRDASFVLKVVDGIVGAVKSFCNWLAPIIGTAVGFVFKVANGIAQKVVEFWDFVVQIVKTGLNFVFSVASGIAQTVINFWNFIKSVAGGGWSFVFAVVDGIVQGVKDFWNFIKGVVGGAWNFVLNVGSGIVQGVLDFIDFIGGVIGDGWNFVLGVAGDIGEGVSDFIDWVGDGVNSIKECTCNIIGTVGDAITDFFTDKDETFGDDDKVELEVDIAPNETNNKIMQGIFDGTLTALDNIKQKSDDAKDSVGDLQDKFTDIETTENNNAIAMAALVDRYYELEGQTNRTAGEEEQMRQIAEKLKDTYPELGDAIDENTGLLTANKDEVLALVEARKQEALMDALIDEYGKVSSALAVAETAEKNAKTEFEQFTKSLEGAEFSQHMIEEFQRTAAAVKSGSGTEEDKKKYDDFIQKLKDAGIADQFVDEMADAAAKVGDCTKNMQDLTEQKTNVESTLDSVATKAAEAKEQTGGLGDKVEELDGKTANPEIGVNDSSFKEGMTSDEETLNGFDQTSAQPSVGLDDTVFESEMTSDEQRRDNFDVSSANTSIGVDDAVYESEMTSDEQRRDNFDISSADTSIGVDDTQYNTDMSSDELRRDNFDTSSADTTLGTQDSQYNSDMHSAEQRRDAFDRSEAETELKAKDSASSTINDVNTNVRKVPDSKSITLADIGGSILVAFLSLTLKAAINSIPDTKTITFEANDYASSVISHIKSGLDRLYDKTVTVNVNDYGDIAWVQRQIDQLPSYHYLTIYANWVGDQDRSFYATVYWQNIDLAKGGVYNNGSWRELPQMASGGIFNNGFWSVIPSYAAGTAQAHGTIFRAGENGPEVVGHVNGRTEVLNKSQIAAAIYAAVKAAMGEYFVAAVNSIIQSIVDSANSVNTNIGYLREEYRLNNAYLSGLSLIGLDDVGALNSYYNSMTGQSGRSNLDALADKVAAKISGNFYINNQMTLDGKVVYDEMVTLDRLTVNRTGKSAFG